MDNLSSLFQKKQEEIQKKIELAKTKKQRPVNTVWEQAQQFSEYVGVPTTFVLRCFKIYGMGKVLAQTSFMKDAGGTPQQKVGLLIWRLKGGTYAKK